MAGKVRIEIDIDGFNEARREPQAELDLIGHQVADRAGGAPDYMVISTPTKTRARTVVVTATAEAMIAEAKDRTLSSAFGAQAGG